MPNTDTRPEIKITINGKECTGREGQTILEVANDNSVYIPTLCYLKKLSPVGACRMCIVEVEKMPKIVTSCSTPATNGMVVHSNTEKLQKMRRMIMELFFSERNHYCPFCEKSGGDCDLQNKAYENNMDHIRYPYLFPNLPVESSHPYFYLDHNRCILCSRCVRWCDEVEGVHAIDFGHRGRNTLVCVDLNSQFAGSSCTSCGGCVQACPTGALFNKMSAYRGKTKDCEKVDTICQQCSLGCGITVYSRGNHLVSIDGDESSSVNAGHLCVNGRYEPLTNQKDRVLKPTVSHGSGNVEFSWEKALDHVAYRLRRLKNEDPSSIYAYISPKMTNESVYRFMQLFREVIGTPNAYLLGSYEYESYSKSLGKPNTEFAALNLETDMSALDESDCIVILGADPGKTHKVLAAKVRSRVRAQKAKLIIVNEDKSQLDLMADIAVQLYGGTDGVLLNTLIGLELTSPAAKHQVELPYSLREEFSNYSPEKAEKATGISWDKIVQISRLISKAKNPVFVFGTGLSQQDNPELFATLVNFIRQVGVIKDGKLPLMGLRTGANARGAFEIDLMMRRETGAVSSSTGPNFLDKLDPKEAKLVFLAMGDDEIELLENDLHKLSQIEFLVVQSSHPNAALAHADVSLPSPVWYEKQGSMNNALGKSQGIIPVLPATGEMYQEWQVFGGLARRLSANVPEGLAAITQEISELQANYRSKVTSVSVDSLPFRCVAFPLNEGGK